MGGRGTIGRNNKWVVEELGVKVMILVQRVVKEKTCFWRQNIKNSLRKLNISFLVSVGFNFY